MCLVNPGNAVTWVDLRTLKLVALEIGDLCSRFRDESAAASEAHICLSVCCCCGRGRRKRGLDPLDFQFLHLLINFFAKEVSVSSE